MAKVVNEQVKDNTAWKEAKEEHNDLFLHNLLNMKKSSGKFAIVSVPLISSILRV